jgi:hypothetical protein
MSPQSVRYPRFVVINRHCISYCVLGTCAELGTLFGGVAGLHNPITAATCSDQTTRFTGAHIAKADKILFSCRFSLPSHGGLTG